MTDQILFDKLAYIDKLKSAGIGDEEARAHGDALTAALRESVVTVPVLAASVAELRTELRTEIAGVRTELAKLETKLTLRMGAMSAAVVAILTAIKFFG